VNLPETIHRTIERHGLIPAGTHVVAGVSGGADSVALLHALHALEIPATVAHLNHRLRGAESDADEAFVRRLADALGFPIVVESVDVQALAASGGQSIEMAARQARHAFFAKFPRATIALAHHADDQAETFLLKLARGAGSKGLGGMAFCRQLGSIRLIRPMLEIPRDEILHWLKANGFEWREDASNQDETFLRNRIRHTVLPMLERELNPNIRKTILRTMDILREENDWMEGLLENRAPEDPMPLAARRRLLRNWLFDHGATDADFDAVGGILSLMDKANGSAVFELNDQQRVVVEYGRPRFEETGAAIDPQWTLATETGTGWRKDHGLGIGILPAEASFDAARIGDAPIAVRTFLPGDRMEPLGMEGSRKLQDIFTDLKVPRARRTRVPVVVCRGEIIWLPGYRIDAKWAVRDHPARSVHVRIEQKRDG